MDLKQIVDLQTHLAGLKIENAVAEQYHSPDTYSILFSVVPIVVPLVSVVPIVVALGKDKKRTASLVNCSNSDSGFLLHACHADTLKGDIFSCLSWGE